MSRPSPDVNHEYKLTVESEQSDDPLLDKLIKAHPERDPNQLDLPLAPATQKLKPQFHVEVETLHVKSK